MRCFQWIFWLLTLTGFAGVAYAQNLTTLNFFTATNGSYPNALTLGTDGNFYGTTFYNGSGGFGTVFRMSPNGLLTTLVAFTGSNGGGPNALALGSDGCFYGTTDDGGDNGIGTVFKVTTSGALTTLTSFSNTNGAYPQDKLCLGTDGNFYGTTYQGGNGDFGTVFKITTNGSLTTLASFANTNGANPFAGLTMANDRTFYGTTYFGGSYGYGTIFKITTNGILATLISFTDSNGRYPYGGLTLGADGCFYGTTQLGGANGSGTIFKITTNGTLTTLVSFTGDNGESPDAKLTFGTDGNLYGSTEGGGVSHSGTIFELTTNDVLTTLASFANTNGGRPYAELTMQNDGSFYGTTLNGGINNSGTIFRLSFNNYPVVLVQPTSQSCQIGSNTVFGVTADGALPLSYQWYFNGQNLVGQMASSLTVINAQLTNSGSYSVIVTNTYGSVTSSVAVLSVFSPPLTPAPNPPTANLTTQLPPTNLIARPRIPSGDQFKVFTNGVFMGRIGIDTNKMTIVLTHGWRSSSDEWPSNMASLLYSQAHITNVNIVAWDWRDDANTLSPSTAAAQTAKQGEALGAELYYLLGANYNKPIHFMGHSLGAMVNCHAADYIHGDSPNSPSKIVGSSFNFNPQNTHMTMFDEAELVTAVNGLHVFIDVLSATGQQLSGFGDGNGQIDTASSLLNNFWAKVIPDHYVWIDNYISEVGLLHPEAANVMLWRDATLNPVRLHGYSYNWYSSTVTNPVSSLMGFRESFEQSAFPPLPATNAYFLQSLDLNTSFLNVSQVNGIEASALSRSRLIVYPTLQAYQAVTYVSGQAYQGLIALGNATQTIYLDGVQYTGDFVSTVSQEFLETPAGQPVYSGVSGSTPSYYASSPAGPTYQANWTLQFSLQKGQSQLKANGLASIHPNDTGGTTNNGIYAWIPVIIPTNVFGVSFEYEFVGAGTNEYMTMGVSNVNFVSMESRYVPDSTWVGQYVTGISGYSGQQLSLFFSLNSDDGSVPSGQLNVRGIQFSTMPPPTINMAVSNQQAVVSWPISASGWSLETATALSASNLWTIVTNIPSSTDYQQILTNTISTGSRFYRLHMQ